MKKFLLLVLSLCGLCFLNGCGGGSAATASNSTPPVPLAITSAAPPGGTVQTAYSGSGSGFSLTASGGTTPYAWSWAAAPGSSFPPGLNLLNGSISGTPSAAGTYNVVVTVTDAESPGAQKSASYTIVIDGQSSLTITSGVPPSGTVGKSYDVRCTALFGLVCQSGFPLQATGGVPPYVWSWAAAGSSSLPPGLNLSNGSIGGRPTTAGTYNVVVTVTDSDSPAAQKSAGYTIVINGQSSLTITSGPPPVGTVQTAYGFSLTASGGTTPYTWSWAASPGSSLPPGLNLSNGSISGAPSAAGTYNVVVTVTDSDSPAAQKSASYTIVINGQSSLAITSGVPPSGTVGTGYGVTCGFFPIPLSCQPGFLLKATGGVPPYVWSWVGAGNSSLPPGLGLSKARLNPSNGAILGTPTAAGSYNLVVTVTDSESPAAQKSAIYTIVINNPPPPVINTTSSPGIGTLNAPYVGFTFTATGGLPPLTWSETGTLPPGMALGNSGLLSGTPTAAGSFPITVTVQDSAGQRAVPQDFTIQVLSQGFTPTGSMGTARASHTATLLSSGKVLVAGGGTATAEFFDPSGGSFSPTGSMETERTYHTATLLNTGKVLVAGGLGSSALNIATAELFDPASGSFAPTGSMQTARAGHTATLLNDGKVLVAGGVDDIGVQNSTDELFDPASGTFALTGGMQTARSEHTATLLNNGKVLVTGGMDAHGVPLASAELFDPASGSFAPTGNMATPRVSHTATLLGDGKVLVTGGLWGAATAEIFDPASGTFATTGSMGAARYLHTATLLSDGKVLVAGGLGNPSALSAAELFDPTSGTFAATADMTTARSSHTATLLTNGDVLVTGGYDDANNSILATAELYE